MQDVVHCRSIRDEVDRYLQLVTLFTLLFPEFWGIILGLFVAFCFLFHLVIYSIICVMFKLTAKSRSVPSFPEH